MREPVLATRANTWQPKAKQRLDALFTDIPQPRIVQIEPVHDLVVVIARRRLGAAREGVGVRPFKINLAATFLVKKIMVDRIVKRVLVVRHNAPRTAPRARDGAGFRIPDFTQE